MAAALNYSVNLVDTGGGGLGPYTMTILKNPTAASGGTDVTAQAGSIYNGGALTNIASNALGTINPQELMGMAAHVIGDGIAAAQQSDSLN